MTIDMVLVLSLLGAVVLLLIVEWIPFEITALMSLVFLSITGLISPTEALSGFSSPAVVTIWAFFILSGGLTRTGVASLIGRLILRLAGRKEIVIIIVIMVSAGLLSPFMSSVALVAMMLPVVMDITRQTGHSPARLLMPLSYGCLLGGPITVIGTAPNIFISNALKDYGFQPFHFFDFAPIVLIVMFAGTAFVAFIGRHLLTKRDVARESSTPGHQDLREEYELRARMFLLRIPPGSPLAGKTLSESRLGSALGIHVIGILRDGHRQLAPDPSKVLLADDLLIVEGRLERMDEIRNWRQLSIHNETSGVHFLFSKDMGVCEASLRANSSFAGRSLEDLEFHNRYGLNVLAIRRGMKVRRTNIRNLPLRRGDTLLFHGMISSLEGLSGKNEFSDVIFRSQAEVEKLYHLGERLFVAVVPEDCDLIGKTIEETDMGETMSMRVVSLLREGNFFLPGPEERFQGGDHLLLEGNLDDYRTMLGLEELEIEHVSLPNMEELESARVGLMEAILSPRSGLAGKTLRRLHFREKYGLSVIAIWREGRSYRSNLGSMALRFGDALLLYGTRERLKMLGHEPDFIVLTQEAQEPVNLEKAPISISIMLLVIIPVVMGLLPIYISAILGAALMVLTKCLTMNEAYRSIDWKSVFVIAGLLPLGIAIQNTGAAKIMAEGMISAIGPFGPIAVLAGMMVLTFIGNCFIPPAALVVLMTPIGISAAAGMNISPRALMMGVAIAASESFMTPVSHPANLLIMGPGGYHFVDYFKVGAPLSLLVLLTVLLLLPHFWHLSI